MGLFLLEKARALQGTFPYQSSKGIGWRERRREREEEGKRVGKRGGGKRVGKGGRGKRVGKRGGGEEGGKERSKKVDRLKGTRVEGGKCQVSLFQQIWRRGAAFQGTKGWCWQVLPVGGQVQFPQPVSGLSSHVFS
jgi:hypothetical protein